MLKLRSVRVSLMLLAGACNKDIAFPILANNGEFTVIFCFVQVAGFYSNTCLYLMMYAEVVMCTPLHFRLMLYSECWSPSPSYLL